MDLVDADGRVEAIAPRSLLQPTIIAPAIAAQIPDTRGRAGADLGGKGKGVGLQHAIVAVPGENGIFIECSVMSAIATGSLFVSALACIASASLSRQ